MNNNNPLIDQLTKNLKPVKVKSFRYLTIQYFSTLSLMGLIFIFILKAANGSFVRIERIDLLVSLALFGLSIVMGSILLAQYSRPNTSLPKKAKTTFWSALIFTLVIQLVRFLMGSEQAIWGPPIEGGWKCATAALMMGVVVSTVLFIEVRREAPVKPIMTSRFLLLSAGLMATIVLQIHCPNENPLHQLLWHMLLPLGAFALSAKMMARLVLRW